MAPRTRRLTRSKTIIIPDSSQHTIAEDQAQLEGTQRDAADIQHQLQTAGTASSTITTNACRKGKSHLSSVRLI